MTDRGEGTSSTSPGVVGGPSAGGRLRLVVITDPALARPRTVVDVVREALGAGAPAVQLRDKTASAAQMLEVGRELRDLTARAGALLFVNDRLDVALALDADGVHLGPDDIPVAAARLVVPASFLIGASADDPTVARQLVADGADYIGCGTVYPTTTKGDAGHVIGVDGLRRVCEAVDVPVVGIGGVTVDRAEEIAGSGASGSAVVSAVMTASHVGEAVRGLLRPWDRNGGPGR